MHFVTYVDTMDKWDEDKLKEVVKKKQNKPKTDIVSHSVYTSNDTLSLLLNFLYLQCI